MIVPAGEELVAPHVGRPSMDQHEKGILLLLIEVRGKRDHVVNLLAALTGEPEMPQRLPIDGCGGCGVEAGQRLVAMAAAIDPDDFGRIDSGGHRDQRSEEHTSELQSHSDLVCRLLLEKKKKNR